MADSAKAHCPDSNSTANKAMSLTIMFNILIAQIKAFSQFKQNLEDESSLQGRRTAYKHDSCNSRLLYRYISVNDLCRCYALG